MTDAYSASSLSCAKGTRSRATSGKTKVAAKNKAMMSAAGSSRVGDEDVDMVDVECTRDDGERQEDRHSDDDNDDMGDDGGGGRWKKIKKVMVHIRKECGPELGG